MNEQINATMRAIHAENVARGWWSDPKTGESILATRDRGGLLALVHSELSEALDGFENEQMDDHLTHRRMAEVELADAKIRIFDIAGAECLDLGGAMQEVADADYDRLSLDGTYTIEEVLLRAHRNLSRALEGFRKNMMHADMPHRKATEVELATAMVRINNLASGCGFDLAAAIEEKRAYNGKRADHQIANRLTANGKKF